MTDSTKKLSNCCGAEIKGCVVDPGDSICSKCIKHFPQDKEPAKPIKIDKKNICCDNPANLEWKVYNKNHTTHWLSCKQCGMGSWKEPTKEELIYGDFDNPEPAKQTKLLQCLCLPQPCKIDHRKEIDEAFEKAHSKLLTEKSAMPQPKFITQYESKLFTEEKHAKHCDGKTSIHTDGLGENPKNLCEECGKEVGESSNPKLSHLTEAQKDLLENWQSQLEMVCGKRPSVTLWSFIKELLTAKDSESLEKVLNTDKQANAWHKMMNKAYIEEAVKTERKRILNQAPQDMHCQYCGHIFEQSDNYSDQYVRCSHCKKGKIDCTWDVGAIGYNMANQEWRKILNPEPPKA